ncbi:hypothetical protein CMV_014803 [Castanea mollissima]|uniref:NmrA-like domain-containing protein n=1 Tax=Castanea mollissima TaxID=60419 RepID=A0A8J4VKM9_9ROSI|nr:hypothetical protein CMV_014803 [Castanea mollissima]
MYGPHCWKFFSKISRKQKKHQLHKAKKKPPTRTQSQSQRMSGEEKVVCVTGASGYIASWLVKLLLQRGYTVKATVRDTKDLKKTEHLLALDGAKERLKLFKANLLDEGSFDSAVDGCQGVFHTASPVFITASDPQDKGQASTNSVAVSAVDNIVDDNVSLTRTEYQQFLSLLNSQSHFGTQGPQDLASESHQVVNIIAQATMGFAGHEMPGISFQNLSKIPINSLEYSVFSSHVNTTFITSSTDWILDSGATDHI